MNDLDLRRRKLELSRVCCAREELELKIEEYKFEIDRINAAIVIQKQKEAELTAIIKGE